MSCSSMSKKSWHQQPVMHKLKESDFGLKFHKISAEDKQTKRERKEQKKKEKRELREQKRRIKLPSLKGIFGGGGDQPL